MKFFSKIALFIALISASFSNTSENGLKKPSKKIILWDLGFTLLKPDTRKMSLYIVSGSCGMNPWNLIQLGMLYPYGHLGYRSIQDTMDIVLNNARADEPQQTLILNQHGLPTSNIECDHMNGTLSDEELFAQVQESIRQLALADSGKSFNERVFKNSVHKKLIERTLQLRLAEPQFYGECYIPIPQGVELLEKCVKAGHTMAILSNWGIESFGYAKAYEPNQVIFKHFKSENIFISAEIKASKPDPESFKKVIEKMHAQPEDFIFIDDQIKNVQAARALGMHAIHITDYKNPQAYKAVEEELKRLAVL